MTTKHPSTGLDKAEALFRAQRLDEINAPHRVHSHLSVALDVIEHMDPNDVDRDLALVILHCAKAVCAAVDGRT